MSKQENSWAKIRGAAPVIFIVEMTDITDNGLVFHLLYVLLKRSFKVVFEDQVEGRSPGFARPVG
jgi:hypothetical protein